VRSPARAGVALLPAKGGGSTPTLAVCGNPSCLAVLLYYWMVAETFRFPEITSCPKISFWGKRQKPPERSSDGFSLSVSNSVGLSQQGHALNFGEVSSRELVEVEPGRHL